MNFRFIKAISIILIIFCFQNSKAETVANSTEIQTCQKLVTILKPRGGVTPDSCYNQARELNTQFKFPAGNFAEYLKLSKNISLFVEGQKDLANFKRSMVISS